MAKPQIFNRDMKRLAYLDNALAVGYGLDGDGTTRMEDYRAVRGLR